MKKRLLITIALIGLLVSCDNPSGPSTKGDPEQPHNPTPKTLIVFDNTYGICTAVVYDDYRRRDMDKIAEVPAGKSSAEFEWTPSVSTPFYFAYRISLKGVSGFAVDFVPEVGKDQKAVRIDADTRTVIPIPVLDDAVSSQQQTLSPKSYLTVLNSSAYSFQLHRGVSMIRPDNSPDSGVVNSGERAPYTVNPGRSSDYRLLVGIDYISFPDSPDRFEAGNFYSYQFTDNVSFDTGIPINLDNMDIQTYTVIFNGNGGSGEVPAAQNVRVASVITLPFGSGLSNGDKVFGGWGIDASGSGIVYSAGTTYTVTSDIILYAKWYPAGVLYTVAFNSAGGNATASQRMESGAVAIRPADPYRAGYTFGGWYSDSSMQTLYDFETPVTGNLTLYAAWDANRYTVTFNANGAEGAAPAAVTVDYGVGITLPTAGGLSKPDETFYGWNTEDDGTGTGYASGAQYTVTADVTLFAVWGTVVQPPDGLIEMVWVPGGSFEMGSTATGYYNYEETVHTVTLGDFYIGRYEVTQAQYQAVMENNPSYFLGNVNYPVERVTWYDAIEFCNKLSSQEGLETVYTINNRIPTVGYPITKATVTADWSKNGYRLPTEAEWEYTAKGGNGSPGNFTYSGNNNINEVAWYEGNSGNTIHNVGTKAANSIGIFDMSGNIAEWCWDWFDRYSSESQINPLGPSAGSLSYRVIRGGDWSHDILSSRSAHRNFHSPDNKASYYGFRLARGVIGSTTVTSGVDSGPGSLRYAIENAEDGSTITIDSSVGTIALTGRLEVNKSVTIEGNGVTITRDPSWTTVDYNSQLMYFIGWPITVNISRLHFKDGRATDSGGAFNNYNGNLNLESCIFSGNQNSGYRGGAIYHRDGIISIKGCTFYGNKTGNQGGVIEVSQNSTLTLEGNLFYGNTASSYWVVYLDTASGGTKTITSRGYNVVDVPFGTGSNQCGWPAVIGDKNISDLPFSTTTFRLLPNSGAANVITTRPANYPTVDFYGNPIPASGAAAGAVQSTVSGSGYNLDISVNDTSRGTVNTSPVPNQDGLFSGTVTLTANAHTGYEFSYWLVDGEQSGSANPLTLTMSKHTKVQAAFGRVVLVTNFNDDMYSETTAGTLRNALANAQDWDIIRFSGVTPGTSTVALYDALPEITKSITIEGSGITLTGSYALRIANSFKPSIIIRHVHFKNFIGNSSGGVIYNGGIMIVESCIFSNNHAPGYISIYDGGGAIQNIGILTVKGCTFYGNSAEATGGAIYSVGSDNSLTLIGNLFYENTASAYNAYPVVDNYNDATTISNGYNAVDVVIGRGSNQAGWEPAPTDTTFADLSITGTPINTTTFAPVSGLNSVIPNPPPQGFPTTDFYGNTRTFPGAPGAVN